MNLSSQLAIAEQDVNNNWENHCLFTSYQSALRLRDELRESMISQIRGIAADQANMSLINALAQSPSGATLAAAGELVAAIEGDKDMMSAIETFRPILAKRDLLAVEFAAEKSIADRIEGERLAALEAAKNEAIAKLEIEFAASPESEPSEPAKPFRGKVRARSEASELVEA